MSRYQRSDSATTSLEGALSRYARPTELVVCSPAARPPNKSNLARVWRQPSTSEPICSYRAQRLRTFNAGASGAQRASPSTVCPVRAARKSKSKCPRSNPYLPLLPPSLPIILIDASRRGWGHSTPAHGSPLLCDVKILYHVAKEAVK